MCTSTKAAGSLPPAERLPVAERRQRLAYRHAVGVGRLQVGLGHGAAQAAAAEAALPETASPPRPEHGHTECGRLRQIAQLRDRFQRGQDAQRPVEASAVGDGVEVRAGPDLARGRIGAGQAPVQVAARVPADRHVLLPEPGRDQLAGLLLGCAQPRSVRSRAAVAPDLSQL